MVGEPDPPRLAAQKLGELTIKTGRHMRRH
jgi:hypothetical protein